VFSNLSQFNPTQMLTHCFKTHFNIIISYMPTSSSYSHVFRSFNCNFYPFLAVLISHPPWHSHDSNTRWRVRCVRFLVIQMSIAQIFVSPPPPPHCCSTDSSIFCELEVRLCAGYCLTSHIHSDDILVKGRTFSSHIIGRSAHYLAYIWFHAPSCGGWPVSTKKATAGHFWNYSYVPTVCRKLP
jgi:hypothetical protein